MKKRVLLFLLIPNLLSFAACSTSSSDPSAGHGGQGGGHSGGRSEETPGPKGSGGKPGEGGSASTTDGAESGGSGSSGGSDAGGGQAPSIDDLPQDVRAFCKKMEDYTCDFFELCRNEPCDDQDNPPMQNIRRLCTETLPPLWKAGLFSFDAELARTCLPEVPVCASRWADAFDTFACRDVFSGTLDQGEPCNLGGGWLLGSTCRDGTCGGDTCPHTCGPIGKEGDDCDQVSCAVGLGCIDGRCERLPELDQACESRCLGSLRCADDGDGPRCLAEAGLGQPCSTEMPCVDVFACVDGVCSSSVDAGQPCTRDDQCPHALKCVMRGEEMESTCQAPLDLGEPCQTETQCADPDTMDCRDPDYQDNDDTRVCVPLGSTNEPCEPYGCRNSYWCQYPEPGNAEDGVCRPPGGLGDGCESARGPRTDYGLKCLLDEPLLVCIEGTCSLPGRFGEPCLPDDLNSCSEGWCSSVTGKCERPVEIGEDCNPNWWRVACEEGAYCPCPDDACRPEDTGSCVAKKPNSALCDQEVECQSNYCGYADGASRCADPPQDCPTIEY